ncbi:serine hydrolase domain-containing protein [Glycomyces niveus]|uniref:Beta-lactamase family protein n=1 Tax=Glycomyces niveus TaxID=2820287 RepID=A0ABS3TYC2_9ACTN|nr:serine hydrolase domain-containing protein [Glycomyces sp. NEAU-S30]MBO3731509.1 beta-lactamase family protein [Glycomyces sp. NEAU-S30]
MRRIPVLLAAALLAAGCTADPEVETGASGCDPAFTGAIRDWAAAGFSGALAWGDGAGFDCRAAFGMADTETPNADETVFAIGSISKAFTAAAVLDLVDAGSLALDDRAGGLLPGLGGPAADATVEQLLLHTSGLEGEYGEDHRPLERDAAVALLSGMRSAFEPGTEFLYSNAGYALLALIVDEATGDYRGYLAEEILVVGGERIGGFWDGEPAAPGPRAVGTVDGAPAVEKGGFAGPHWALAGNGDLAMTAAELRDWTDALFTGGVVSEDAVELLLGTRFDNGDGTAEIPGWVSVGPDLFGAPVVTASGGGGDTGHNAVAAWLPETGTTLAVASNGDGVIAGELVDAIAPALIAGEPIPAPEPHAEIDPAELRAREGVYTAGSGSTYTVTAEEDGLLVAADGADAVAALFASDDFTPEDVAAHEAAVLALLNGETAAGREERDALEAELGAIAGVSLAGTTAGNGELQTYVRLGTADGDVLAWYALGEHGDVGAVAVPTEPPAFTLVPIGDGEYRPADLAGADVRVAFEDDLMTAAGPGGGLEARRDA